MARKRAETSAGKRRKNGLNGYSNDWQGFVDVSLTQDEREHVAALCDSDEIDVLPYLLRWVEEGYKVSISPHNRGASVIATLTGRSPENPNLGFSLSAFGPSVQGALYSLIFKHEEVCEGGVWANQDYTTRQQLTLWG